MQNAIVQNAIKYHIWKLCAHSPGLVGFALGGKKLVSTPYAPGNREIVHQGGLHQRIPQEPATISVISWVMAA